MSIAQIRRLERQLAECRAENDGLRRMVLDVASTPDGLALLDAGGAGGTGKDGSEGEERRG